MKLLGLLIVALFTTSLAYGKDQYAMVLCYDHAGKQLIGPPLLSLDEHRRWTDFYFKIEDVKRSPQDNSFSVTAKTLTADWDVYRHWMRYPPNCNETDTLMKEDRDITLFCASGKIELFFEGMHSIQENSSIKRAKLLQRPHNLFFYLESAYWNNWI